MDCTQCGAPLPAKSNICTYCGTLNETDLRALKRGASKGSTTERTCPRCKTPMVSIDMQAHPELVVERCQECFGIFFDPGELDTILDESTSEVHEVDLERLNNLIEEESLRDHQTVSYVPCPECEKLMHRKNYGGGSGVIIDKCKDHGVWLDGGELRQIVKWIQAGGRVRVEQRTKEARRLEQQQERHSQNLDPLTQVKFQTQGAGYFPSTRSSRESPLADIVRIVNFLIR